MLPARKNLMVITMILLPLAIMGVVKYGPSLLTKPRISSISILPPHIYAPGQYNYMIDDIPERLRQALSTLNGVQVRRTPLPREVGQADKVDYFQRQLKNALIERHGRHDQCVRSAD